MAKVLSSERGKKLASAITKMKFKQKSGDIQRLCLADVVNGRSPQAFQIHKQTYSEITYRAHALPFVQR